MDLKYTTHSQSENTQKNEIANISVSIRDISKVGVAPIAFSPKFFIIFAWNFQDMRKSAFRT